MRTTELQIQEPFLSEFCRAELSASRNAVLLTRHSGGAPMIMDVGRYNASVARGQYLTIAQWNDILDRHEHSEKSLFSGYPSDEQFVNFVSPEQAEITITVKSDVRQVGTIRLIDKLQQFLIQEGYVNVGNTLPPHSPPPWEKVNEDILEAQKRVKITITDGR